MSRSTISRSEEALLIERDEEVLLSLALHQLLSFRQIRRLHFAEVTEKPPKRSLARLAERGLAAALTGLSLGHRSVWHATAAGYSALGLAAPKARVTGRGTIRVRHALAVNDFGVSLAAAAAERGDRFTAQHWQNEVAHKIPGALLVPDAVLTYELANGSQAFRFLEVDLGTMPVARVQAKLLRYSTYWRSEWWRRDYPVFPKLAVVLGGRAHRDRLRRLLGLASLVRGATSGIEVLLAASDDVDAEGPLAPVWHWAGEEGARGFLR